MIRQPNRNYDTAIFSAYEKSNIDKMNEFFGDIELTPAEEKTLIWLCGCETSSIDNLISAFMKVRR